MTACGIPVPYNASEEWADKKVVLFSVPGNYSLPRNCSSGGSPLTSAPDRRLHAHLHCHPRAWLHPEPPQPPRKGRRRRRGRRV